MEVEFEICEKCGRAIPQGSEFYYNNKILCEKCFTKEIEENLESATIKSKILLVRYHKLPKVHKTRKVQLHPILEELLKFVKV